MTKFPDYKLRHPPFDAERRAKIERIMDALVEVYPQTYDEWERGFRVDMHPDREIAIWISMAEGYEHFTKKGVRTDQKSGLFQIIFQTRIAPRELLVNRLNTRRLPRRMARAIFEYMYDTYGDAPPMTFIVKEREGAVQ